MIYAAYGLIRQEFLMARRYWLNTISAMLFGYAIFVLLFWGIQSFSGPQEALGTTVESLLIGYWVVVLTNMTFQSVESFVAREAMTGTLEQLYLSPYAFWWLAFGKMLGAVLYNFILNVLFLFLMMLTTGRWLNLEVTSILPLVLVLMTQAYGIGFVMGGLALIYKRIGALSQAIAVLLILFITAPPTLSPFVRLLPFNLAWRLLRSVMAEGVTILALPTGDLVLIIIQTLLLCWMGWAVYSWGERTAKQHGLLSQH
jgi:ABC-2 type transport system permease protein